MSSNIKWAERTDNFIADTLWAKFMKYLKFLSLKFENFVPSKVYVV